MSLLTGSQLAAKLGVSASTIGRWKNSGLPWVCGPGGHARFNLKEAKCWLSAQAEDDRCGDDEEE